MSDTSKMPAPEELAGSVEYTVPDKGWMDPKIDFKARRGRWGWSGPPHAPAYLGPPNPRTWPPHDPAPPVPDPESVPEGKSVGPAGGRSI